MVQFTDYHYYDKKLAPDCRKIVVIIKGLVIMKVDGYDRSVAHIGILFDRKEAKLEELIDRNNLLASKVDTCKDLRLQIADLEATVER